MGKRINITKDKDPYLPLMMLVTIEALKELNNSAKLKDLKSKIAEIEELTPEELSHRDPSGQNRFGHRASDARSTLKSQGMLKKVNGTWELTERGKKITNLDTCEEIRRSYSKSIRSGANREDDSGLEVNSSNSITTETEFDEQPTNLILYGPPGTGKTFRTFSEAVKLCVGSKVADRLDEGTIMKEFQKLSSQGRIEFVTFHQSYSYQEFVEGLRPVTENQKSKGNNSSVGFNLVPHNGIFKKICNRANGSEFNERKSVYQIAVNYPWVKENSIKKCLDDSVIFIGWAKNINWNENECENKDEFEKIWSERVDQDEVENTGGRDQSFDFLFNVEIGDYVILADGKERFVAIGEVAGPYFFNPEYDSAPHFRKVNWLWVGNKSHKEVYANKFRHHAFYKLVHNKIDWDGFEQILTSKGNSNKTTNSTDENSTNIARGKFSGKVLKPNPVDTKNPRRKDTYGWHSYEILRKHSENGILYEDFIKSGGRWRDLQWDFVRNRVSVEVAPNSNQPSNLKSNFVLIIDEINRANISKVFGELITLLEDDKRIGADHEILVRLPYSGEIFGVPKNLNVIGTMNTADRSIAQLDSALRRRFIFEELMPDPNEIPTTIKIGNGSLQDLFVRINERIEHLYDRDHQIGHAYFKDCDSINDVKKIFHERIIPLLSEYFFDDREKIAEILEDELPKNENKNFDGCFFKTIQVHLDGLRLEKYSEKSKLRWEEKNVSDYNFDKLGRNL